MIEVLRENTIYRVELDEDTSQIHLPHRSWGAYRVVNRSKNEVLFESPNRDKAYGVYEFLSRESNLPR